MFERWAIRHKPTGHYLPQSSRKRHGYTHDEPVTMESNFCPRLFAREQDAKTALTWWLKGETSAYWSHVSPWDWDGEADYEWHEQPRSDRKAEDMQVVKVFITVEEAA